MKRTHEEDERGMISIEGSKAVQCCGSQKWRHQEGKILRESYLKALVTLEHHLRGGSGTVYY